jgi:hypothetical protein
MELQKFAILLSASALFSGCAVQSPPPQMQASPTAPGESPIPNSETLKVAVKELQVLQVKLDDGTNYDAYGDLIGEVEPLLKRARGNPEAIAAANSSLEGHRLALAFWQCDRLEGYVELHQCRGQALSEIFAKYPEIETYAKEIVDSENVSAISAKLDRDAILETVWVKTSADTETANQVLTVDVSQ